MKAFQRILAVLLCLVMSLGMISMVASAATTDTIDTTAKGSLTIHKYEYNRPQGETATNGTGASTDTVPSGAKGLNGVKFKVTKVADIDYYMYNNADSLTLEEAQATAANATGTEYTTQTVKIDGVDTDGIIQITNMDLGIYLVQETDAPAQITGKTPDFLVSIPMTTTNGADWLYDVHVFPKNSSTYAGVTLLKQGRVGGGTASALSGATFVLQKLDGNTWTTVTEDNKGNPINGQTKENVAAGKDGTTLTTGNDGKISVSDLAPGEYRFVETSVGNGYIMDGTTTYGFVIADGSTQMGPDTNDDGKADPFPAGTVLINGKAVDTTQNPITVINDKPDMDKQIQVGKGQEAADYSVGDHVPYVITVKVPMNIDKLTTFTLSDTLTNQKFDNKIEIKNSTKTLIQGDEGDYTVSSTAENKFTIRFNTSKLTGGDTLTVTYTAELLNTADTTTAGNPNSAVLTYTNKLVPNTEGGKPNEGGQNTITDETVVYTFELKVDKDDENGAPLENVEFDVYAYNGTATTVTEAELKANGTKVASIKTDAQGLATVTGLKNGTYYLVETKTVADYNLLKAPVAVTLNISYEKTWTVTTTYDDNGNAIKHDISEHEEYFGGSASAVGANYVTQTIVNKKGFNLPQTGGIGTLMFIIIGGVLMAGGICLIVPNKKRAV